MKTGDTARWEKINVNEDRVETGNYSVGLPARYVYECSECGCNCDESGRSFEREPELTVCPLCGRRITK